MKCIYKMKVKINTKEKFTVLLPEDKIYTANMAAEIKNICLAIQEKTVKSIIIDFSIIEEIEEPEAKL